MQRNLEAVHSVNTDLPLLEGEVVLEVHKPHKLSYVLRDNYGVIVAAVFFALIVIGLWILFIGSSGGIGNVDSSVWLYFIPFSLLFSKPAWMAIAKVCNKLKEYSAADYVLTNKRVASKIGVSGSQYKSIYYNELKSAIPHEYLDAKLFGVADIYVRDAEENCIVWHNLKDAEAIAQNIEKYAGEQELSDVNVVWK